MNNNLEEKLKVLRIGYLNKLKDVCLSFKLLLEENPINIQEVYSKIHTISGTSGLYGLNALSNVSTEFEFYLKPLKENPDAVVNTKEIKEKLSDYISYLETVLMGD